MTDLATRIGLLAEKALLYEVALTPKPGLVDRANNGAHHDMDFYTFIDSILALAPFFPKYFQVGFDHQGDLKTLFEKERHLGGQAEKAMLSATKGINTHKGANFSFAVLLGACGFYRQQNPSLEIFQAADTAAVLMIAAEMTGHLPNEDFKDLHLKENLSYGERLYVEKGLLGIRGEAAAGYPNLAKILLPYWRKITTDADTQTEDLMLRGLILLMSEIEDGNLLHRGGFAGWQQVKAESKKIQQADLSKAELLAELKNYDQCLIERHLSPGGAADVLALGIFFALLEGLL